MLDDGLGGAAEEGVDEAGILVPSPVGPANKHTSRVLLRAEDGATSGLRRGEAGQLVHGWKKRRGARCRAWEVGQGRGRGSTHQQSRRREPSTSPVRGRPCESLGIVKRFMPSLMAADEKSAILPF